MSDLEFVIIIKFQSLQLWFYSAIKTEILLILIRF